MQQSAPVVGRYDAAKLSDERVQERAGGGAEDRAHAADDHDDERVEQPLAVLARARCRLRRPDDRAERGEREPTTNAIANVPWMLIPSAEVICRSSTPARITIPVFVR